MTEPATHETDSPPLQHVLAGGRRFAYREAGAAEAPALVILHGVGAGSASWAAQLASLPAHGLRVIAWDAPGYGESEPLPEDAPAVGDYAAALGAFVEALGLERFTLLGHSLGTLIAAAFAGQGSDSGVERLVLASPTAGYRRATPEQRREKIDGRLADFAKLGPAGLAEKRGAVLLSPAASPAAVERVRAVMRGLRPDGYAQAVRMLGEGDIFADAARITMPTLVLCGSADVVTPEAGCRRIAEAIAGARYEALPGLGHACYVEDPARFDAALLGFVAGGTS